MCDSGRVYSRCVRRLADRATGGRTVRIGLSVRRLSCENPARGEAALVERVPGLTVRYQRRTPLLRKVVETVGVLLAGRCSASGTAERAALADQCAVPADESAFCRLLRHAACPCAHRRRPDCSRCQPARPADVPPARQVRPDRRLRRQADGHLRAGNQVAPKTPTEPPNASASGTARLGGQSDQQHHDHEPPMRCAPSSAAWRPQTSSPPVLASDPTPASPTAPRPPSSPRATGDIHEYDAEPNVLAAQAAPDLLAVNGVGPETAARLLAAVGDNPERPRSDAALAHLRGVTPHHVA